MNKRLQELAEQAEEWNEDGDKCDVNLQKFAELIIQECIDCVRGAGLADDVALRNKLGFNNGIAEGVVHIQKHFGVAE